MRKLWIIVVILPILLAVTPFLYSSKDSLVLGEFKVSQVLDGDTITVAGVPQGFPDRIRFLNVDTEESEKGPGAEERSRQIAQNFKAYMEEHTRHDFYPKVNTPMGWQGTLFARQWFPLGSVVRIEFDEEGKTKDYYNRILGYVFVKKGNAWVNYNVECVRAGMSPYSDKYGVSKRFEHEFIKAEREARINQLGIWAPGALAYPDYDGRLRWWNRRAHDITNFEKKHRKHKNAFQMINELDWNRLSGFVGKEVILFGVVEPPVAKAPVVILPMHHNDRQALGLTIADERIYAELEPKLNLYQGDYVYFKGKLEKEFSSGKLNYKFGLKVNSVEQFFVDNPGMPEPKPNKSPKPVAAQKDVFWEDAAKYLGEEILMTGKIAAEDHTNDIVFYFNKEATNISVVIPKKYATKFPEPPHLMFRDRVIRVRGQVTQSGDRFQLMVSDPKQIQIIE